MALNPAALLSRFFQDAFGFGIGSATADAIRPFVQPEANKAWSLAPTKPLDPGDAALVEVRSDGAALDGGHEAAQTGLDSKRFAALVEASRTPPGAGELLELLRRGAVEGPAVEKALRQGGTRPEWTGPLLGLRRVFLSPADAAMARQQGFVDQAQAREIAGRGGVEPLDADLMFELSGLPYGIGEALDLLRRGKIDEGRFRQVVREGHTKTKYTDDLLALQFTPLSASIAAEALIRERVSEAEAVKIAAENGIRRDDFLLWSNMLGRPVGIGQAQQAVNRGLLDRAGFREVVARSDVRTEYADLLFALRRRLPSIFQLRGLIANGSISDALAGSILRDEGYSPELIDGIISAAHGDKTKGTKDLTQATVLELYEAGLESHAWAVTQLEGIGYDAGEAESLLLIQEARRLLGALNAAISRVHARFVGHEADEATATARLDALGITAEARNRLIELWDVEREANVRRLTAAQVGQALKHGLITRADAVGRWQGLGYPKEDAELLAGLAGAPGSTPV